MTAFFMNLVKKKPKDSLLLHLAFFFGQCRSQIYQGIGIGQGTNKQKYPFEQEFKWAFFFEFLYFELICNQFEVF
jgi:hypothetical protein